MDTEVQPADIPPNIPPNIPPEEIPPTPSEIEQISDRIEEILKLIEKLGPLGTKNDHLAIFILVWLLLVFLLELLARLSVRFLAITLKIL